MRTAAPPLLRHGFKAKADRMAVELRQAVDLKATDPLPARVLSEHVGVPLLPMQDVPGLTEAHRDRLGTCGCHGLTLYEPVHVLYNGSNSPARQEADITHELAHLLLKHPPNEVVRSGGVDFFRDYDAVQEEEARWLGGCLQIPRQGMLWSVRRGMTTEDIADYYTASIEMARYRRNVTGVDRQVQRVH